MTIATIQGMDATGGNEFRIPLATMAAGYTTGSGGIQWSESQFAARTSPFPPIRIDQDPAASDHTADVLDFENGAATLSDLVPWYEATLANFHNAVRPGQRKPVIYCSMSPLDSAIQQFKNAGITNVGFWTAQPGNSVAFAVSRVANATGPYPCIGCQFQFGQFTDSDVWSLPWVSTVSQRVIPPPPPPTANPQFGWEFCTKCGSLVHTPEANNLPCAAGGKHAPSSHNYGLNWK